jgi:hypothetical protein
MSKPEIAVPAPPATLPNGKLDCDADPDPGGLVGERQQEQIAHTLHEINTPGDVLRRERERREELEHALALAKITSGQSRAKAQAKPNSFASRNPEKRATIARAAQDAGTNNRLFCEFLDRDGIPAPPAWGVRSWLAAWDKKELRSAIRSFKRHHKSAA